MTNNKDKRAPLVLLDIDGTLVEHNGNISDQFRGPLKLLPGTLEKMHEFDRKGYRIILLSGRRESTRKFTEQQLSEAGIFYDQLILGVGGGVRHLINDTKPNSNEPTAIAITVERNKGIGDLDI